MERAQEKTVMTMANGAIEIDIDKLADGIYELIKEHPDGRCLSLGMLPADLMITFEKMLENKIPDEFILPSSKLKNLDDMVIYDGCRIRRGIINEMNKRILDRAEKEGIFNWQLG